MEENQITNIRLFHTNDIHSHFETWPTIVGLLKSNRASSVMNGEENLTFDIGDFVDRFHPISEATLGKGNVILLNEAGYDAITIGNNEGITLSKDQLVSLYEEANFDVLIGNLTITNNLSNISKPYQLFEKAGVKIGVIGLTVSYPVFYHSLGWAIQDPFERLSEILPIVKDQADIIIILSHLGIKDDLLLAEKFEGIDIILGAHTHHLFPNGEYVGDTLLCGTGKHGNYLGEVLITFNKKTKTIINLKASVIDVHQVPIYLQDERTIGLLSNLMRMSEEILAEPVTFIPSNLPVNWFKNSPLPNILASALKQWTNAEISMINAGILLDGLNQGIVTKGQIHRICPHPINPCIVELSGKELLEVINRGEDKELVHKQMKGFGFRGKVIGMMVYDGVTILNRQIPKRIVKEDVLINNQMLDLNRRYKLGTLDMFTFGHLFQEIYEAKYKKYFMPEFIRDVLNWSLKFIK